MTTFQKTMHKLFHLEDRKMDHLFDDITIALVNSVGDVVVAVVITALALGYMLVAFGDAANLIAGYYIAINVLLTTRRVIHRVDDRWTVDELAEAINAELDLIKQQLDRIEHNS